MQEQDLHHVLDLYQVSLPQHLYLIVINLLLIPVHWNNSVDTVDFQMAHLIKPFD